MLSMSFPSATIKEGGVPHDLVAVVTTCFRTTAPKIKLGKAKLAILRPLIHDLIPFHLRKPLAQYIVVCICYTVIEGNSGGSERLSPTIYFQPSPYSPRTLLISCSSQYAKRGNCFSSPLR